ncbi:SUMO-activating enzyme subunit 1 [Apophysomyces ossiformis]|uniref:Ubiquitin-like 1-activating enzyme E1A n=1 Tax=Apophysomyces ossiformis TaxID=679940 RepID=A0A8H7EQD3_9FUNG|nr:SUMO-activating enzyme subunit 1 [Apophysomyces ossiformis]
MRISPSQLVYKPKLDIKTSASENMAANTITQGYEAAIYDRQIRLWGLDAQQRHDVTRNLIRDSHILVAGIRAISNEALKNLALAGVGSITLLDHGIVREEDLGAQFFLTHADIGKNRAVAAAPAIQALNPRVSVQVDQEDIRPKDDAYFQSFDIVCLIHTDPELVTRIDRLRREVNKPFYAADAFGWFGYIFCDLMTHAYTEEKKTLPPGAKSTQEPIVKRTKHIEQYDSFEVSLQRDWSNMTLKALKKRVPVVHFLTHSLLKFQQEHKRSPTEHDADLLKQSKAKYLQQMGVSDPDILDDSLIMDLARFYETELAPVAAILGGVLAQEIIRALSGKEFPIQNWFFYNGLDGSGVTYKV